MVFDFLLLFQWLNFSSLLERKKNKMIDKIRPSITEVVELFEYKKTNKDYWDGSKLHKQVVNKALLITKVLYLRFSFFFLTILLVILSMHKMRYVPYK